MPSRRAGVVTERGTHDEPGMAGPAFAGEGSPTSANQITEAQVDAAAQEVEVEVAVDELTPAQASTPPKRMCNRYVVKRRVHASRVRRPSPVSSRMSCIR